jgi:hypothetical protein
MAYTRGALQRLVDQKVSEVHELAQSAAAVKPPAIHSGNARAVISPVFQTLEPFDKNGRRLMLSQNAYYSTHSVSPFFVTVALCKIRGFF